MKTQTELLNLEVLCIQKNGKSLSFILFNFKWYVSIELTFLKLCRFLIKNTFFWHFLHFTNTNFWREIDFNWNLLGTTINSQNTERRNSVLSQCLQIATFSFEFTKGKSQTFWCFTTKSKSMVQMVLLNWRTQVLLNWNRTRHITRYKKTHPRNTPDRDDEFNFFTGNHKPHNAPVVFSKSDPRRQFSDLTFDPRIHFLIMNCQGFSSSFDFKQDFIIFDSKCLSVEMQVCFFFFIIFFNIFLIFLLFF